MRSLHEERCVGQFDRTSLRSALNRLAASEIAALMATTIDGDDYDIVCDEVVTSNALVLHGRSGLRDRRDHVFHALTSADIIEPLRRRLVDITRLLLIVDRGYDVLLDHRNSSVLATLDPLDSVSLCLTHAASLFEKVHKAVNTPQPGHGFETLKARRTVQIDGDTVDPDVAATSIAKTTISVLKMEASRNNWVAANKLIVVPQIGEATVTSDVEHLEQALAIAWDQWHRNEERLRHEGGALQIAATEVVTKDGAVDFGEYTPKQCFVFARDADALRRSAIVELGRRRLMSRQFADAYFANAVFGRLVKVADKSNHPALAPAEYISPVEAAAFYELCDIYAGGEASDLPVFGGLNIAEWLRAYLVLCESVQDSFAEFGTAGLMLEVPNANLLEAFRRGGLSKQSSRAAFDAFSLHMNSVDLFDAPIIRCDGERAVVFGPALVSPAPTMILFSVFQRFEETSQKGFAFEESMRTYLSAHGFAARGLSFDDHSGIQRQYDAVFEWDGVVFIIECKNWLLPFGTPITEAHFLQRVDEGKAQVRAQKQALVDNHVVVKGACGIDVTGKRIITILCNSLPYWEPAESLDDVLVLDASILRRFFDEPKLNIVRIHEIAGTQIQHRHGIRMLWTGDKPKLEEFLNYVAAPPQVTVAMAALSLGTAWFPLTDETAVLYSTFSYRELSLAEEIEAAGGDSATIIRELEEFEKGFKKFRQDVIPAVDQSSGTLPVDDR